ncbi:MAG: hypothetical protein C0625_00270 [Arcobacter sp.]|nr:MAG: hypothetical protein C0625_00270 [Arcobacter sp.]
MMKSYIWSIPTRVFHILFALFILLAFLTGDEDRFLNYHAVIGYFVFILLSFRIIWGFFGPKHSRFKDFPLSIKKAKDFMLTIFEKKQNYVGHNPMASYVMVAMLVVTFLIILSGVLTFGIQEGKGLFSYLNSSMFKEMDLFKEIHEILSNLLIALIAAHLGGVVFDRLFHKKDETLNSIVTGYKVTSEDNSISLNMFQKTIFIFFVLLFVGFVIFNINQPKNLLVASVYTPIDYKVQNELFVTECGSCHTLYTPNLLPKKSWRLIMSDLENHFGDDASLEKEDNISILNFLLKNSAEESTKEVSFKILDSIKNKDIIAISDTVFWKHTHKDIPKTLFSHEQIKSKANCKACHLDIEKGLIEDENIKSIDSFK